MFEDRLLKIKDCLKIIPVSRAAWYAGVKERRFPAPVKLGAGSFWKRSDLLAFIANASASDQSKAHTAA